MKEKILEALKALGFQLEEIDDIGYDFVYEGKHYLYMYSEDDEDFLNLAIPAVQDIDKDDITPYKVMDTINSSQKYIKAYDFFDSMWLFYERELIGDEDLKRVLAKMILRLEYGYVFLHKLLSESGEEEESPSESADNDTNNDTENGTDNDEDAA